MALRPMWAGIICRGPLAISPHWVLQPYPLAMMISTWRFPLSANTSRPRVSPPMILLKMIRTNRIGRHKNSVVSPINKMHWRPSGYGAVDLQDLPTAQQFSSRIFNPPHSIGHYSCETRRVMRHSQRHRTHRTGWLRAAVLGANDGIVSTASLILGVAATGAGTKPIVVAGVASLVAGAMSMAAGEYVSVSSQADTESADLV